LNRFKPAIPISKLDININDKSMNARATIPDRENPTPPSEPAKAGKQDPKSKRPQFRNPNSNSSNLLVIHQLFQKVKTKK